MEDRVVGSAVAFFGGFAVIGVAMGTVIGLAGLVLWIWMLVEVLSRETDEGQQRLVWALVIVFTHWVGALLYLVIRRRERIARLGR